MSAKMSFTKFTVLIVQITANAFRADVRMNSDSKIVVRDAWIPRANVSTKADGEIEQLRAKVLPFKTNIEIADWYVSRVKWS